MYYEWLGVYLVIAILRYACICTGSPSITAARQQAPASAPLHRCRAPSTLAPTASPACPTAVGCILCAIVLKEATGGKKANLTCHLCDFLSAFKLLNCYRNALIKKCMPKALDVIDCMYAMYGTTALTAHFVPGEKRF